MYRILPYKLGSSSAKLLATGLDCLRINPNAGTYRRKRSHKLINWGCSNTPFESIFLPGDLNHPRAVAFAADKLVSFELFKARGVPCPEWTHDKAVAEMWRNQGFTVYGRDTARGSGGSGISLYHYGQELGHHLFYTCGIKVYNEYRIHIGKDQVIDITKKGVKNGHVASPTSAYIRSHQNGWIFMRNNIKPAGDDMIQVAKDAVRALDLDFGAVDICRSRDRKVTVFEVNTAPGIEGTTLNRYIQFFKDNPYV